jgi:hypothetical protein
VQAAAGSRGASPRVRVRVRVRGGLELGLTLGLRVRVRARARVGVRVRVRVRVGVGVGVRYLEQQVERPLLAQPLHAVAREHDEAARRAHVLRRELEAGRAWTGSGFGLGSGG